MISNLPLGTIYSNINYWIPGKCQICGGLSSFKAGFQVWDKQTKSTITSLYWTKIPNLALGFLKKVRVKSSKLRWPSLTHFYIRFFHLIKALFFNSFLSNSFLSRVQCPAFRKPEMEFPGIKCLVTIIEEHYLDGNFVKSANATKNYVLNHRTHFQARKKLSKSCL